jgi:16S rRNA (guanine(1405)-N(7))-methyltransferase
MNERERAALQALLNSAKYGALPEETLERAFERALEAQPTLKAAEKAARAALHQMSTMYFPDRARKDVRVLSEEPAALDELFALHASTRERMGAMDALYDRVFARTGEVFTVDYACGLNPLYLGRRGVRALGIDIHRELVDIVNRRARRAHYPVSAEVRDVLLMDEYPRAELALAMKFLPVLEAQKRGFAAEFLSRVPCKYLLATFPKKSLGGRGGRMEAHYDEWFLRRLPARLKVRDKFVAGDELCYLTEVDDA